MNILGISAYYHDASAALVTDGVIVAAAQEERFTRIKHDPAFPISAVTYCLSEGGISAKDLDYIVFYEKPLLKFERLMETYVSYAPRGFKQFLMAMPIWLKQKLFLKREIKKALGGKFRGQFVFTEHHESHAASAFFPSPFESSAILTLDGVGEWATASIGIGQGNKISLSHVMHFPHSLGLLYSAFTYFTGFRVNSGEYKLMGLAPYGDPIYYDLIMKNLLDLKEDGSFRLNMDYFDYPFSDVMCSEKFADLFSGPRRRPETDITQREMDIAASIQKVTEVIVLRIAKFTSEITGMKNLVLAGGVALNCVSNGRILRESDFDQVWIQPAAGDAGGALGGALFVWYQLLEKSRMVNGVDDLQSASWLGPNYSDKEIRSSLNTLGAIYDSCETDALLVDLVATLIDNENVIGWFQGRMEFGPRALGARSIIGDARSEKMQSVMNLKIKFRESFRPFAPCVLREDVADYFETRENEDSPYMLIVAPVVAEKRLPETRASENLKGLDRLKGCRSIIPAITHVDYSARLQTIDEKRHGRYYRLVDRFKQISDSSVIINTSFNIRGEPIVCTPEDAYRCFMATDMDVLVLENQILYKDKQPKSAQGDIDKYKGQFKLD